MISRKYELFQTALSGGAILVVALVNSVLIGVALAVIVVAVGVGHVVAGWRRERLLRARLEEELKETPWMLAPGPQA